MEAIAFPFGPPHGTFAAESLELERLLCIAHLLHRLPAAHAVEWSFLVCIRIGESSPEGSSTRYLPKTMTTIHNMETPNTPKFVTLDP